MAVGVQRRRPVQIDGAGGDGFHDAGAGVVNLQDVAVLQYKDAVRRGAQCPGQLGMGAQMAVFAVDGYEIAGPGQVEHQFQLLLAGVAVDMDAGHAVVQHHRSLPQQVVDGLADGALVAGDGRGRDDDGIAGN